MRAGDFILYHGLDTASRLMQVGQALRIHGDDRRYCRWSHAALVFSESGLLIEGWPGGLRLRMAGHNDPGEAHYVPVNLPPTMAAKVQMFAAKEYERHGSYGWLTVLALGLRCLTGAKVSISVDGAHICSGFVAEALSHVGIMFGRDPENISPADLAKYFQVEAS